VKDFRERVQALIDRHDEGPERGKISRAAASIGLKQPTLFHLLDANPEREHLRSPSIETVMKIARRYNTTVEWLMDGMGPSPFDRPIIKDPSSPEWDHDSRLLWQRTIDELGLSEDARAVWRAAPMAFLSDVFLRLVEPEVLKLSKQGGRPSGDKLVEALGRAASATYRGWAEWLQGWIGQFGAEAIARRLEQMAPKTKTDIMTLTGSWADIQGVAQREAESTGRLGLRDLGRAAKPPAKHRQKRGR
jgi:hypothetical protein